MELIDLSRELFHRTQTHPNHPPVIITVWSDHSEKKHRRQYGIQLEGDVARVVRSCRHACRCAGAFRSAAGGGVDRRGAAGEVLYAGDLS